MRHRGLTYEAFAERCQISRSAMWRRVKGLTQVDEVDARYMARILDAPVTVLFDIEADQRHRPRDAEPSISGRGKVAR
jgi:transcriptional regulator with XRE-family HTH domain